MDYKSIEQLLERYWECETSIEEEQTLRDFFSSEEVPAHLHRYKDLFVYQQTQSEVRLGDDFDQRVLAHIEAPVVKAKRMTVIGRFMPVFKAAATVAIVLLLGNVAQHSMSGNDSSVIAVDTIGKQMSAPSVAVSEDVKMERAHLADSLKKVAKQSLMQE